MSKRWLMCVLCLCMAVIAATAQGAVFFPPDADVADLSAQAPYTERFAALGFNRPLTFLLYDLDSDTLLAGIDIDRQMPVVSAIKGPILMYFLSVVPREVWAGVPVEFWPASRAETVPEAYRAAWTAHRAILRDLYRMIVASDNIATGNALLYAHRHAAYPDANPIQAFNRWSVDVVGTSGTSGLREWDEGGTNNPAWIEPRYNNRTTLIRGVPRFYNNMFSALDVARYYHWLMREADTDISTVAQAVMSIVDGFPGFLEDAALRLGATPVSKDGFVGPNDRANSGGEYLTADAGLILLPEGGLIVVSMGVNGGDRLEGIYNEVQSIVRRTRAELYWPPAQDYLSWIQGADGPYGAQGISTEGAYFVIAYLTEAGARPQAGQSLEAQRALFTEARDVWLAIFPDDRIPESRDAAQNRVVAARYGNSGERLMDIARELGLAGE